MDVSAVIAIIGGIALLVGVFGGGIELKELKVPPINSILRVLSFIVGIVLILGSVIVSRPELLNLIPAQSATQSLPNPAPPSAETASITETPNWAITFELRFPAGFWSVGTHEYHYEALCLNIDLGNGNGVLKIADTRTFEVTENAALFPGDVYLRLGGLRDGRFESNVVDQINPSQTTTAVWSLIEITQADAELAFKECTVTVIWDGGAPKQLEPELPFQR